MASRRNPRWPYDNAHDAEMGNHSPDGLRSRAVFHPTRCNGQAKPSPESTVSISSMDRRNGCSVFPGIRFLEVHVVHNENPRQLSQTTCRHEPVIFGYRRTSLGEQIAA